MNVVIRADASNEIGSGHVMRCLTLAGFLKQRSARVTFVCRELKGNLISFIAKSGFDVRALAEPDANDHPDKYPRHAPWLKVSALKDAQQTLAALESVGTIDWLIVDHYALEKSWELQMKEKAQRIFVIDDLADREHRCDGLLDQNLHGKMAERYQGRVPDDCELFLGPKFAILRPEFSRVKSRARERDGSIRRVLVFMGGSDPENMTQKALDALSGLRYPFVADVVVGASNQNRESIENFCKAHPAFNFHFQVSHIAELMNAADLSIGGGGTTTWERCYLGLPAIIVILSSNQMESTEAVTRVGAAINLGHSSDVTMLSIRKAIEDVLVHPQKVRAMSQACLGLSGGVSEGIPTVVDRFFTRSHATA